MMMLSRILASLNFMTFSAYYSINLLRHHLLIKVLHEGTNPLTIENPHIIDVFQRFPLIVCGDSILGDFKAGKDLWRESEGLAIHF